MSMKMMEELKDVLCEELDQIAEKGEISLGELDTIEKLTTSIKNIDKIVMADRYSYDGGSYDGGYEGRAYDGGSEGKSYDGESYGRTYANRGGSYAGRRRHYVRGHYSYAGGDEMVTQRIEEMMNQGGLNASEKEALKKALEVMRK